MDWAKAEARKPLRNAAEGGSPYQTARRLRPRARRALITLRPFLVAMRERNPCVRFRLMVLGWYVRFMAPGSVLRVARSAVMTGLLQRAGDSKDGYPQSQIKIFFR